MRSISPPARWGIVALGAIALSSLQAGLFKQAIVNANGFPLLLRFFQASIHPDISRDLLSVTLNATVVTFAYAICGTFLSLIIGAIAGLLCSEIWWLEILRAKRFGHLGFTIARGLLAIPRAIHELIWGLFFVNLWGLDPLVAIVAIAIPFGAITAKIFSEILDETPRQPMITLVNSGVSPIVAFFYALLPQAFLDLLSYAFYRFECSIRSATVLGIIGAGGLGYEIFLSLQSLRYEQLWTFFYALFLLNAGVDTVSARLRNRLGCASRVDLNAHRRSRKLRSPNNVSFFFPAVVITIGFSFWFVHPNLELIGSERSQRLLNQLVQTSLPPDFSNLAQLVPLSIETVAMSILAIAFAAIGGVIFAFPATQNALSGSIFNKFGFFVARSILLLCRSIPAPIWALVVLYVLFPGILPGAIGLGLHNLGILGRLFSEVIENLEPEPIEALNAQGTPPTLTFLYGILPLTLPRFTSYALYRWEVCLRETVIVGLVGAGGLGRSLTEQLSSFDYRALIVTLTVFLVLTFAIDFVSALMRRSLR